MNNNNLSKLLSAVFLMLFCAFSLFSQEADGKNALLLKLDKVKMTIKTSAGGQETEMNGEMVFSLEPSLRGLLLELETFSMVAGGVETKSGDSGNLSFGLLKGNANAEYNEDKNVITCECLLDVHYPLIDKLVGYKRDTENEMESDVYVSYTESFIANFTISLYERIDPTGKNQLQRGAVIDGNIALAEPVVGQITSATVASKIDIAVIIPFLFGKRWIDIQPVFIRYTPSTGVCCGGGNYATTGGSYPILRDRAVEMWDRCCIGLNFLPPVYITNDNYRILSSSEESSLRSCYDDPNAVEVFFVEVGDPLGLHGGGVCYSVGTANTQVITYDVNLPINVYNLAHELGHSLGLYHPPGNSSVGSLMEPSGFTKDNPPLMSSMNCNNASNPLLYYPYKFQFCFDDPNM